VTKNELDQTSGENSANLQAGGNIAGNVIVVRQGITEQRAREIYEELFARNTPALVAQGAEIYVERAQQMGTAVVGELHNQDPELLNRFAEPRAQIALLKAQQNYGETGNVDTGPMLAKMVAQLIASDPQSYTELISRRCLECITNMTSTHLNLVTVIALLQARFFPNSCGIEMLVPALANMFRPYFNNIPDKRIEYDYVKTLGIGAQDQVGWDGYSPYNRVRILNPNAMYPSFSIEELPELARSLDLKNYLIQDSDNTGNFYLHPEFAKDTLKAKTALSFAASDDDKDRDEREKVLLNFCQDRMISAEVLKDRIKVMNPDLADLFDTLEKFGALQIILNPVGLMLAAQEETIRSNGEKSQFMELLEPR
jgi:hypothetical protein